ncbi:MAG TPA: hypothetical protein VMN36_18715 [Verrucomicrobiales bacterium]|nr:hypothetical protein [Verrucomicrobiales bacterium]
MRGSPPLRIAVALLGVGLAVIPLARLTRAREVPPTAPSLPGMPAGETGETPALLRLRFSPQPSAVTVLLEGRELIRLVEPAERIHEIQSSFVIPPEGIELVVEAQWPLEPRQAVLSLEVEPEGLEILSRTAWTDGPEMKEYFLYQWR